MLIAGGLMHHFSPSPNRGRVGSVLTWVLAGAVLAMACAHPPDPGELPAVEVFTIAMIPDTQNYLDYSHQAEEAMYFLEGEAEYTFAGKTHRVGPGDLLFFPPNQQHAKVKYLSDRMKYLVIRSVEQDAEEECCCGEDRPPHRESA